MSEALWKNLPPKDLESFRLVQLLPSSTEDSIQCQLFNASISAWRDKYIALSYCCGPAPWDPLANPGTAAPDLARWIIIQGIRLHVYVNLHDFLQHCVKCKTFLTLWIDQVCINQNDVKERSQQVRIMHSIYSSAKMVMRGWVLRLKTAMHFSRKSAMLPLALKKSLALSVILSPPLHWNAFCQEPIGNDFGLYKKLCWQRKCS